MKTIKLNVGEKIKIIGQKSVFMVIENVNGEIYSKMDSKRDDEENYCDNPSCLIKNCNGEHK